MSHLQVVKGGEVMGLGLADYVWLDEGGRISWKKMTVLIAKNERGEPAPLISRQTIEFPKGKTLVLVPVHYLPDPTRPQPNFIVLCETKDGNDKPVAWNYRAQLREAMLKRGHDSKLLWFGFEQTYSLGDARGSAYDAPRAIDLEERKFMSSERFLGATFDAGLLIHSTSGYPGSTVSNFKVGVRGFPQDIDPDPPHALVVADHMVLARYLMHKIGAGRGLVPSWAALSAFVSSATMREASMKSAALVEANLMLEVLEDLGSIRLLPHAERGGTRCIGVDPKFEVNTNPYQLALDVLCAVMPIEQEENPSESVE